METVQVVLGKELLRAADRAARRVRMNRSALIRNALRAYLKRLSLEEREQRDRAGHVRGADREFAVWDRVATWPDE